MGKIDSVWTRAQASGALALCPELVEAGQAPGLCIREGLKAIVLDGNAHPGELRHPDQSYVARDDRHAASVAQRVPLPVHALVPFHAHITHEHVISESETTVSPLAPAARSVPR